MDIFVTDGIQSLCNTTGKRCNAVNRENCLCELCKDCRLITGTCSYFQYFFVTFQFKQFCHNCNHVGLRNRLIFVDGKGHVIVGLELHGFINKEMTGHLSHCVEDPLVMDASWNELGLYHE